MVGRARNGPGLAHAMQLATMQLEQEETNGIVRSGAIVEKPRAYFLEMVHALHERELGAVVARGTLRAETPRRLRILVKSVELRAAIVHGELRRV